MNPASSISAVAALRAATAADHAMVDQRFGGFDLRDVSGYGRFLQAHALALPAIEAALENDARLPPLRFRGGLIEADLVALGRTVPTSLPCARPVDDAAAFGMAYVIEGSRLGGVLIARSLPPDRPASYLSAAHGPGEWRGFLKALDEAADGADWIGRATDAARGVFARYAMAADQALLLDT